MFAQLNMIRNKKGQITIIIFLAVLIFISFTLVFVLITQSQPNFEVDSGDLEYYNNQWKIQLEECTDQAIKGALLNWAGNGGIIFNDTNVTVNDQQIPVGIPSLQIDSQRRVSIDSQDYKAHILRPLNPPALPNNYGFSMSIKASFSNLTRPESVCDDTYPLGCSGEDCFCTCSAGQCELSHQAQLKTYVKNYTNACFKPITDELLNSLEYDLITDVQFGAQSVITQSTMHANTTIDGVDYQTNIIANTEVYIRVLSFLNSLEIVERKQTNNDAGSLEADLAQLLKERIPSLQITRSDYNDWSILHINLEEELGNVLGRPLTFNYIRQNRAPMVLDETLDDQHVPTISTTFKVPYCIADADENPLDDSSFFNRSTPGQITVLSSNGDELGTTADVPVQDLSTITLSSSVCPYYSFIPKTELFQVIDVSASPPFYPPNSCNKQVRQICIVKKYSIPLQVMDTSNVQSNLVNLNITVPTTLKTKTYRVSSWWPCNGAYFFWDGSSWQPLASYPSC